MTPDRTKLQIEQFEKALNRLREAVQMNETDIVRDGLIQRFEFTFEMAWRSVWRWLGDHGERMPELASAVLEKGFQAKLIHDAELWTRVRQNRNLTSHTYKEDIAIEVAAFVRSDAMAAFDDLLTELKGRA